MTTPFLILFTRARDYRRRHPWRSVAVLLLSLMVILSGSFYAFATYQWRAAQKDVKAENVVDAERRLQVCLFVWPRSIDVHLLAARAARLRGDFESTEAHLNRCIKLNHGATEAVQLEFLLMRAQGGEEDEVAPELLALYVEHDHPQAAVILATLSRAYMFKLRYGPAFDCLSRWIELEPDSAEPWRWRGLVRERLSDHEGAMQDFKQALQRDPNNFSVLLRLGELFLERSDPSSAAPYLEKLWQQHRDRPEVQARLGQCRYLQGEHEEARQLLESAVKSMPNDPAVLVHLANLDLQEERYQEAEAWLRRALKVDGTDTEAQYLLSTCLHNQKRFEEANAVRKQHDHDVAALRRVSKVLQDEAQNKQASADDLSELGSVFLRSNERVGLYWLNRALQRDPAHQASHKALAEYYEKKGNSKQADIHRQQLKTDKSDSSTAKSTPRTKTTPSP